MYLSTQNITGIVLVLLLASPILNTTDIRPTYFYSKSNEEETTNSSVGNATSDVTELLLNIIPLIFILAVFGAIISLVGDISKGFMGTKCSSKRYRSDSSSPKPTPLSESQILRKELDKRIKKVGAATEDFITFEVDGFTMDRDEFVDFTNQIDKGG